MASLSVTVSSRIPAVTVEWQLYNSVGTGRDRHTRRPPRGAGWSHARTVSALFSGRILAPRAGGPSRVAVTKP